MKPLYVALVVAAYAVSASAGEKCSGNRVITTRITHAAQPTHAVAAAGHASKDLLATARAAGSFKTLIAAVEAAGLTETLQGEGPFTVFAPTDEAFSRLPEGTVEELLKPENRARLQAILTYHVVAGRVLAADVVKLRHATTVQGQQVDITVKEGSVMIDGANVVKTDIATSNGVIHVIDRVILPVEKTIVEVAAEAGGFSTLLAAATAAGLVDTLNSEGPFTVLAPSDAAFAKLPPGTVENLLKPENREQLRAILTYHVISGRVTSADVVKLKSAGTVNGEPLSIHVDDSGVKFENATVTAVDIEASNGVIHVIDAVLLP